MLDVNVRGVFYGIAVALFHMLERESGHIILIGSTSGYHVSPLGSVYSATKFAIRAIADSLRMEGGTAIRSTFILPGATETEIVDHVGHPAMTQGLLSIRSLALTVDAVASAISYAIEQPPEVDVGEILVRPIFQKD